MRHLHMQTLLLWAVHSAENTFFHNIPHQCWSWTIWRQQQNIHFTYDCIHRLGCVSDYALYTTLCTLYNLIGGAWKLHLAQIPNSSSSIPIHLWYCAIGLACQTTHPQQLVVGAVMWPKLVQCAGHVTLVDLCRLGISLLLYYSHTQ